jgi:hypothetical protein
MTNKHHSDWSATSDKIGLAWNAYAVEDSGGERKSRVGKTDS